MLAFIRAVLLLLLRLRLVRLHLHLLRRLLLAVQIPVGTAGPPPRAPDPSGHCRTSTASSRSQWALLDLNRDFQVAVGTAGPQRPDRMPEDMPDGMSDTMPEDMSDRMPEDMPDRMPEDMSDRMPEDMPDRMPEDLPDRMPEDMPEHMPEDMRDRMPDRMPEDKSDRMPEDLPVRKCINVMLGITRSKVICFFLRTQVYIYLCPQRKNAIKEPMTSIGTTMFYPHHFCWPRAQRGQR